MVQRQIVIPDGLDFERAKQTIERTAAGIGLVPRLQSTLAGYSGCTHWHYRPLGRTGTLEVTLWPGGGKCWVSVHSGRNAHWVADAMTALEAELNRQFAADAAAGSIARTSTDGDSTECAD